MYNVAVYFYKGIIMRKNIWGIVFTVFIFVIFGIYFYNNPILLKQTQFHLQVGDAFDPNENVQNVVFGKNDQLKIESNVNLKKKGKYTVTYQYKEKARSIFVYVDDTKAPELEVQDLQVDLKTKIEPKMFVKKLEDRTKVTLSFVKEPNMDKVGQQKLTILATDAYDNVIKKRVKVERIEDQIAPKIKKQVIKIKQGSHKDLSSLIKVKDNLDKKPSITVEEADVDRMTMGTYPIKVEACDRSGNVTNQMIDLEVVANPEYNDKIVYLTFDDGPSYNTPEVLKILDRYKIKATFFVTGHDPSSYEYIKQAKEAGHTIGLHTYTHDYANIYSSTNAYFQDLDKISSLVEELTGTKANVIRFPGGSSNTISENYSKDIMPSLIQGVLERGYQYFDWNVTSGDASGINVDASYIISQSCTEDANQINLLFHDAAGKETTVQALPTIIEYYLDRGYSFYPISQESFIVHHRE